MALSDQLTVYYKFDDGSGTSLHDATGNGHTGTWGGTLGGQWGAGKVNGGGVFDGSTNYIDVPANALLVPNTAYSVNLWFKRPSTGNASGYLASYRVVPGSGDGWAILADVSAGSVQAEVYHQTSGGASYADMFSSSVAANAWHMVTLTYDGTTVRAYLDGTQYHSQAITSLPTTSNLLTIGCYNNHSGGYCFPGTIDEFGLWMRALSAAEVTTLYNGGSGITYPFSTAYSETLADTFAESESVGHVLFRAGQDAVYTTGSLTEEWVAGYLAQGWRTVALSEEWTVGSLN